MTENCMQYYYDGKRVPYWDNVKGFLIFLVVLGHLLACPTHYFPDKILLIVIYTFHMAAFVFVSGYLSKSEHSRSAESILKLFILYVFMQIYIFLFLKCGLSSFPPPPASIISPFYTAWYLLALIVWRITAPYLAKIKNIMIFLICIALLSAFWTEINMQYGAIKIIVFFPFFMAGFLFPQNIITKILSVKFNKRVLIALAIALIGLIAGLTLIFMLEIKAGDLIPSSINEIRYRNLYTRGTLLLLGTIGTLFTLFASYNKPIPFLTKIGRNSLAIFILHRPITFLFDYFTNRLGFINVSELLFAIFLTIIICFILGADIVNSTVNKWTKFFTEILFNDGKKYTISRIIICVFLIFILCLPMLNRKKTSTDSYELNLTNYRIMDEAQEKQFDNAYKILFTGDLILLEDQVKRAYDGKNYNFKDNFEYTKKYIRNANLAIGVLEGALAEGIKKFSNSNFGDNKSIYVNMPDTYADAIKDAGFDLLTTANNHLLDAGLEGAKRTIDILNNKKIDFVGTYKTKEEYDKRVKLIEKDGLKIAVLSYTYGINNYTTKDLLKNGVGGGYLTNVLPATNNVYFQTIKKSVEKDFKIAKSYNPDLIIVLPHWGTSFQEKADTFQRTWEDIFFENGADIILGAHTHHVQPVKINQTGNKNTFTLYSPGNYANIYQKDNGDASAIVEVYVEKSTKKIIGGAIIPMWTQSPLNGNYRAIPLYDIYKNMYKTGNADLHLSTFDFNRVKEVHQLITKYMLGNEMPIDMIQERYYFDKDGFIRKKSKPLLTDAKMKQSKLYSLLKNSNKVCFIGDSITAGSNNNGAPWYEPIEYLIKGTIINKSWGGETTKLLLNKHLHEILQTHADLYIVAIGTNDIRYRNPKICAMTEEEYISNLKELKRAVLNQNPNAKFVFIAPWISTDGDIISKLDYDGKMILNDKYSDALKNWVNSENDLYINPNKYISYYLDNYIQKRYLVDFIHPNMNEGIRLYSKAVLSN